MITCCGEAILDALVHDVKAAKYFTILADEACDSSNKEQMSLVLRFFDISKQEVREAFFGFVHCSEGLTGKAFHSYFKANRRFGAKCNELLRSRICWGSCYGR